MPGSPQGGRPISELKASLLFPLSSELSNGGSYQGSNLGGLWGGGDGEEVPQHTEISKNTK